MAAGNRNVTGRWPAAAVVSALLASLTMATAQGGAQAPESDDADVRVATTGNGSELVKTLPVTRDVDAEKRVVISMRPAELPTLAAGDRLEFSAEMQITVNCAYPSARCIGPIYGYDPRIRTRLLLASSPGATGGTRTMPISSIDRESCGNRKGDREHHCVVVFDGVGLDINDPQNLPCPLERCFVNLVASAHNPAADRGDVVAVGGNRPDGSIPQDRGRINVVRYRNVAATSFDAGEVHQPLAGAIPPDYRKRVIASLRVKRLKAGEQLTVSAAVRTDISHLRYAVRTSAKVILADSPTAVEEGHFVRRVASLNGEISENNGFNCTQARGGCLTRKVGVTEMRDDAINGKGRPVALYVNVVMIFSPKLLHAGAADRVLIKNASIRATRFPPPGPN